MSNESERYDKAAQHIFSMPDDEFTEASTTGELDRQYEEKEEVEETDTDTEPEEDQEESSDDDDGKVEEDSSDADEDEPDQEQEDDESESEEDSEETDTDSEESDDKAEKDKGKVTDSDKDDDQSDDEYKAFYDEVMAPFKANGKTIKLNSADEAVQLMKMGANYTKKMQTIQPHRKVLLMLENNDLLDEGKLSYLIDLDRKDPEAIKKLLKDSGTDPLDIDMDSKSTYQEGNHRVTDEEAAFTAAVEDVSSQPQGNETLNLIQTHWDQASKEVLYESPDVLSTIHSQITDGTYEAISGEIERLRTLGQIQANVPFLQAYKQVGDHLKEAGALPHAGTQQQQQRRPNESDNDYRVQKPKPKVKNNAKASAASSTRSTPNKTKNIINPLSMSDDEFLKSMQNRL